MTLEEVVFSANDRCNQENAIGQRKSGVSAFRLPSDGLESNWAKMVIAALAWNLKQKSATPRDRGPTTEMA